RVGKSLGAENVTGGGILRSGLVAAGMEPAVQPANQQGRVITEPQSSTGKLVETLTPYIEGMAMGAPETAGWRAAAIGAAPSWLSENTIGQYLIKGGVGAGRSVASQAGSNVAGNLANADYDANKGYMDWLGNVTGGTVLDTALGLGLDVGIKAAANVLPIGDVKLSNLSRDAR
ncbi:hypothetical protein VSS74_31570, partial [Conexibacter stalactiti]